MLVCHRSARDEPGASWQDLSWLCCHSLCLRDKGGSPDTVQQHYKDKTEYFTKRRGARRKSRPSYEVDLSSTNLIAARLVCTYPSGYVNSDVSVQAKVSCRFQRHDIVHLNN